MLKTRVLIYFIFSKLSVKNIYQTKGKDTIINILSNIDIVMTLSWLIDLISLLIKIINKDFTISDVEKKSESYWEISEGICIWRVPDGQNWSCLLNFFDTSDKRQVICL